MPAKLLDELGLNGSDSAGDADGNGAANGKGKPKPAKHDDEIESDLTLD